MELKFAYTLFCSGIPFGSNRTFMELKLASNFESRLSMFCSNRTFMELKSETFSIPSVSDLVLIVPLWN